MEYYVLTASELMGIDGGCKDAEVVPYVEGNEDGRGRTSITIGFTFYIPSGSSSSSSSGPTSGPSDYYGGGYSSYGGSC